MFLLPICISSSLLPHHNAICDEYAAKYPTIVKAIHQENGGHGEGVNQGIRNATGLYYKVVDSDDWLDTDALKKVLARQKLLIQRNKLVFLRPLLFTKHPPLQDFLHHLAVAVTRNIIEMHGD